MRSLEDIVQQLQGRNLGKVIAKTGISRVTVYDIAEGRNTNPTGKSLRLLSTYLDQYPKEPEEIREPVAPLRCQMCFTRPSIGTIEKHGKKYHRCEECLAGNNPTGFIRSKVVANGL
jgi:hypothetical protein